MAAGLGWIGSTSPDPPGWRAWALSSRSRLSLSSGRDGCAHHHTPETLCAIVFRASFPSGLSSSPLSMFDCKKNSSLRCFSRAVLSLLFCLLLSSRYVVPRFAFSFPLRYRPFSPSCSPSIHPRCSLCFLPLPPYINLLLFYPGLMQDCSGASRALTNPTTPEAAALSMACGSGCGSSAPGRVVFLPRCASSGLISFPCLSQQTTTLRLRSPTSISYIQASAALFAPVANDPGRAR